MSISGRIELGPGLDRRIADLFEVIAARIDDPCWSLERSFVGGRDRLAYTVTPADDEAKEIKTTPTSIAFLPRTPARRRALASAIASLETLTVGVTGERWVVQADPWNPAIERHASVHPAGYEGAVIARYDQGLVATVRRGLRRAQVPPAPAGRSQTVEVTKADLADLFTALAEPTHEPYGAGDRVEIKGRDGTVRMSYNGASDLSVAESHLEDVFALAMHDLALTAAPTPATARTKQWALVVAALIDAAYSHGEIVLDISASTGQPLGVGVRHPDDLSCLPWDADYDEAAAAVEIEVTDDHPGAVVRKALAKACPFPEEHLATADE